ncbi:uncharacterized protein CDAR_490561 [Caerostris darwini]|uniref:Gustatory receptor n=1 Tax=Caerostris darwini TaxID=1538125 RepID=A0AAV4NM57_9ARAC|nr:uncharacterized protein CDAR_490561 [Caerostris darwini]
METLPCTLKISGSKFFKALWNFPKYLFPFLLLSVIVIQSLWLSFLSDGKDEWTALIILFLELWIYIIVFRSRTRIRLLTENLYRISHMLSVHTIQRKHTLKLYIWVYCLFVTCGAVCFELALFNSGMIVQDQYKLRNSGFVHGYLKEHLVAILSSAYALMILIGNGFFAVLPGYYCFVCCCMKTFFLHFVCESRILIARQDYRRILKIYKEMHETMIMMENFMNLPILVSVVNILITLFWFGYSFAFTPSVNNASGIFVAMGFIQYFVLLLVTLLPAAAVNQAATTARETVLSLPGWFPKQYSTIKVHVCREFMRKTTLTLWRIYRIDNSLLINALGTLISYGFLVGTLGRVQNSNNEN